MLPPAPPSPPSGPPRGTYFSRRKLTAPSPPLPAWTSMRASSKNFMSLRTANKKALPLATGLLQQASGLYRQDAHDTVIGWTALAEYHLAVDAGIKRVVAADADVGARVHARAPLTHQDAAGGDDLPTEALDAQALGFRIAAVA